MSELPRRFARQAENCSLRSSLNEKGLTFCSVGITFRRKNYNPMLFYYAVFQMKFGWLGVCGSPKGLHRLILPCENRAEVIRWLKKSTDAQLVEDKEKFRKLIKDLRNYFAGKRIPFDYRLDLSPLTNFQKKALLKTKEIPYGETRSYKWVAESIGNPEAARAIGQVMAKNPLPIIIPCHRVIASNGKLGGFGWGPDWKRRLLRLEGLNL